MIFCNLQQLITSCWTYPNYYYWDWSSLVFLLLNLNNCIIAELHTRALRARGRSPIAK